MKHFNLKKTVAYVLAFMMLLSTVSFVSVPGFAASPSDFVDFPTGWSKEAVTAAVDNGLIYGRTPTTIEPTGNLTRAEMATIINRAFGATKEADISAYTDVSPSAWYYHEIAKAVNMQTFQGSGVNSMRPEDSITRQEVFAVIARALVLESSDFSSLNRFYDANSVSDWAKPYASILVTKGYVNGDNLGNINPLSNITREEFAQIMHNIIKTYYTTSGEHKVTGTDSSLIRTPGVTLSDVTIEGDLILGDGVGTGNVNLVNVTIKGRLLARGGEGKVTLTNTTVGEFVVVKDVNGTVNFNNYRTEAPFKGIVELTKATFLDDVVKPKPPSGGPSGGPSGPSTPSSEKITYTIRHFRENPNGSVTEGGVKYKEDTPATTASVEKNTNVTINSKTYDGYELDRTKGDGALVGTSVKITDSNKEFKLYYKKSEYNVSISLPDGSTQTVTYKHGETFGSKFNLSAYPDVKFYYMDGTTEVEVTENTNITSALTILCKAPYTVTLNHNDGKGTTTVITVTSGEKIGNKLVTPTRDGYTFDGWNTKADGTGEAVTKDYVVSKATTAYAQWTAKEYNINYVSQFAFSNTASVTKKYTIETSVTLPVESDFTGYTGYRFDGWYKESSFATKVNSIEQGSTGDITLYARWIDVTVTTYKVTFNYNYQGAPSSTEVSVVQSEKVQKPADPARTGYTFGGWYTDSSCNTAYNFNSAVTAPITLFAKWTVNEYSIEYDLNGGSFKQGAYKPTKYTVEDLPMALPTADDVAYIGKSFAGWYKDANLTQPVSSIPANTTGTYKVYAKWTVKTYTVTFVTPGQSDVQKTYTHGQAISDLIPTEPTREGYTFTGYNTLSNGTGTAYSSSDSITQNLTLYTQWALVNYNITYNYNGGTEINQYASEIARTYNIESSVTLPNSSRHFIRRGYTFLGWYDNALFTGSPMTVIPAGKTGDITLYAKWEQNTYTVTYVLNGGEKQNEAAFVESRKVEEALTLPVASDFKQRPGYEFDGWYSTADFSGSKVAGISSGVTANLTYYAKWNKISYSITYNKNGGTFKSTSVITNSYTVTDTITLPKANDFEEYTGKTFAGWYDNASFNGSAVTKISAGTIGNKSFYAKWIDNTYTVKFVVDGNEVSKTFTHGDKISTQMTEPSKNGYTFDGWYTNAEGTGTKYTKDSQVTSNLTLYPKFTAVKYTITYNLGAGYSFEDGYTAPTEFYVTSPDIELPKKENIKEDANMVFYGWYLDANFTQSISKVESGTYKNITVYAKWIDKTKVFYDVVFNYNYTGAPQNGTYSKISVEENTLIGNQKPADPVREGYTFKGWYADANCTSVYNFNANITDNTTIYAKWEIVEFSINYNLNGGEKDNTAAFIEKYNIETQIDLPVESDFKERPGYSFEGWYDNPQFANNKVTSIPKGTVGNKEYYAKWNKITYTITYNNNGATIANNGAFVTLYTVTDGVTLPVATDFAEFDGKIFAGWYDNANFAGNAVTAISIGSIGNKVFYAKWVDKTYTVKFVVEGTEISKTFTHGDKISTQMTEPSKNGYTFDGWYANAEGTGTKYTKDSQVTSNLTLYPKFTAVKYTITYNLGAGYSFKDGYVAPSEFYVTSSDIELPKAENIKEDANMVFNGWYLDTNFTQSISKVESGTYKDIVVYAKWIEKAKVYYDVTFEYNYVGAPNDGKYTVISVEENKLIGAQKPADPSREGYYFKGWYVDANCETAFNFDSQITSATTIYAKWEKIPATKYTITYNIADGEMLNESAFVSEYTAEDEIILPVAGDFKERTDGKAFAGWYDNANFTGDAVTSIPAGSIGNKTFWAKWDQSYIVRFYRGAKVVAENNRKYIGDTTVAAGTSMAQSDIDLMVSGVNKKQTIAYYDGSYSHTVNGELWYVDNAGEWKIFNSDVIINSNTDVFYANKFLSLCLSVELGGFSLDIPGYIAVPYSTNTKLTESAKDLLAVSRDKVSMALKEDDIYAKAIEQAGSKIADKEVSGIDISLIDTQGNIKYLDVDTPISSIIKAKEIDGEIGEYIETIIVENNNDDKIESAILMVYESDYISNTVLAGVPYDYALIKDYITSLTESERRDFAKEVHNALRSEQYYHDFIDAFEEGHDHFVVSHENLNFVMAVATAVNEYTYEDLKDRIYSRFGKVIDVLGDDVTKEFMVDAQVRYFDGAHVIWDEMKANEGDRNYTTTYPSYLTFKVNVIDHVFKPVFDKYRVKVIDKLNEKNFYHYSENTYLRELVEMDADTIINDLLYRVPKTLENTGYALWPSENGESGFMHYYDYIFHKLLILDNARLWYLNNLSAEELELLRNDVYEKIAKGANKANEMLDAYEKDGSLPLGKNIEDLKSNATFAKVFNKVEGRILSALEKFKTTQFYGKEWTADSVRYDIPYSDIIGHVILGTDEPAFNVDSLLDDKYVTKAIKKAGFKEFNDTFDQDIGSTVTVQAVERIIKNNRVEIRRYFE